MSTRSGAAVSAIIERLTVDDWARVRDIRLQAMRDDPDTFDRTPAEEETLSSEHWRKRLAAGATFIASLDSRDIGIVIIAPYPRRQETAIFGMWVAPEFRRKGIGSSLVDKTVEWARTSGFCHLVLNVVDTNEGAILLYEQKGFTATGNVGTLPPPRNHITKHERALDLTLCVFGAQELACTPCEPGGVQRRPIDTQALQETAVKTVRGAQQWLGNLTGLLQDAKSAVVDHIGANLEEGAGGVLGNTLRRVGQHQKNAAAAPEMDKERREIVRSDAAQYFVEYKGLDPSLLPAEILESRTHRI